MAAKQLSARPEAASVVLTGGELRRRASAGLFIVTARSFIMLLLGFGGSIVLARLLVPRDFGIVAIGTTMIMFLTVVSDGGLGAGLIRRPQAPSAEELRAVFGLQLGFMSGLGAIAALVAVPFGEVGVITAVMLLSLPFLAMQTPGRVVLERAVLFQPLAIVDVVQVAVYFAWAIAGVAAGFGVWALATGAVVRSAIGGALMMRLSGLSVTWPLFSLRPIRPLLGFGIRFQGTNVTWNVRDQGLNAATGAIAGVAALGLWTLARRLLELPLLLFESMWRVSFPAMSQLLAAKEDPAPVIERSLARSSVGAGLVLTSLAASAPGLVPGVFGSQWRDAADVLPWACGALLIMGPLSMCTVGYLFASGNASAVLKGSVLHVGTCFATAFPLLAVTGFSAVGIGWLTGSVVEAIVLRRATARTSGAHVFRPLAVPVFLAVGSGALGWTLASLGGETLLSGVIGGAAAGGAYLTGLALLQRGLLLETLGFVLRAMRTGLLNR